MAVLCGGSQWTSSLTQLPIRKTVAVAKAGTGRFFSPLTQRRSFSSLRCTDPFKSTPVAEDSEDNKEKEAQGSAFTGTEAFLGKLFRGRLWFLILVFLLTGFGAAYGYLVFTFADVADVPILGVTR